MVGASAFSGVNMTTCENDPKANRDFAFSYSCDVARYFESAQADKSIQVALPESITKAFHPKTAGFTADDFANIQDSVDGYDTNDAFYGGYGNDTCDYDVGLAIVDHVCRFVDRPPP